MTTKQFKAMVKRFDGWIEDGVAYFPSVWHRQQFEKATNAFH